MAEATEKIDSIQQAFTNYATNLRFESLSASAVHGAKLRIIDTFGTLLGGFDGEASVLSRKFGLRFPQADGATIIGTTTKTTPDLAAFVNATTARDAELNDSYSPGHPSDVVMPVFSAAEYGHASGKDFITAAVLAYEVTLQLTDATKTPGWDFSMLTGIGAAVGSARALGLSAHQHAETLSMVVIPNNALWQTRSPDADLSMWKALAAGQSGRAGVFAALLARDEMEGPQFPFEGTYGWLEHVAHSHFQLDPATFGGGDRKYKIEQSIIKVRPACARTISSILAAEDARNSLKDPDEIDKVLVEVYEYALVRALPGAWHPATKEAADHSIPYVVGAALLDGTITPRQFDDAHLSSPKLAEIMSKIDVVENPAFTKDYKSTPQSLHTTVTVTKKDGEVVIGDGGDWAAPVTDAFIEEKFASLAHEQLSDGQIRRILDCLWDLDKVDDVAELVELFVR